MLKIIFVLLLVAAAAHDSLAETGPHASFVREASYEAPLNCQGSPAASRASVGRDTCKELLSGDDGDQEDLVAECACALVTHNIWYKNIVDVNARRLTRQVDAYIVRDKKRDNMFSQLNDLSLKYGFNDRLEELTADWWNTNKEDIQRNMGSSVFKRNEIGVLAEGAKQYKEACEKVARNSLWSDVIKPSLEEIEASPFGGANLRHALVATQPELDQLVGFVNLCDRFISKEN